MNSINFSSDEEKVEFAYDILKEFNITDPLLLKKVLSKKSEFKTTKFIELYNTFIKMHLKPDEFKGVKTKTKGDVLEEIVKITTIDTNVFSLFANITNGTNEYDIIITPSELARISFNSYPDIIFQPIICECKNYQTKVDVTWIGKLYMLLSTSKIKIGIIFSYEGLTGSEWNGAKGLIKKIFLKDEIAIINISKTDLDEIYKGEVLYNIIEKKYNEFLVMSNLEKHKIDHNSTNRIEKILDKINNEMAYYKSKNYKKKSKKVIK